MTLIMVTLVHKLKSRAHKDIKDRIKYIRKIHGADWQEHYFNNFRCLMPRRGQFNWRFDENLLNVLPTDNVTSALNDGYSKKYCSQTTRQFRDTILEVIKETETNEKELTDAVEQTKGVKYSFKIFFPIYVKLREIGYNERELQG